PSTLAIRSLWPTQVPTRDTASAPSAVVESRTANAVEYSRAFMVEPPCVDLRASHIAMQVRCCQWAGRRQALDSKREWSLRWVKITQPRIRTGDVALLPSRRYATRAVSRSRRCRGGVSGAANERTVRHGPRRRSMISIQRTALRFSAGRYADIGHTIAEMGKA